MVEFQIAVVMYLSMIGVHVAWLFSIIVFSMDEINAHILNPFMFNN